jgi:hypothetical protein
MKRVKYAIGAAMFAPAVVGAAVPATAHAAGSGIASAGTKTVSLRHSAALIARPSCTVPSSDVHVVNNPTSLWTHEDIWYYNYGASDSFKCIGTVRIFRHFINNNCINVRFNVLGGSVSGATVHACGNAGQTKSIQHVFRQIFPDAAGTHNIDISVFSNYTGATVVLGG